MEKYQNFTNLFQLNKTLRFELKPIGKTRELLKEGNLFAKGSILEKDKVRADSFKMVKKEIDKKNNEFIEETLSSFFIPKELLAEYFACRNKIKELSRDKKNENNIEQINSARNELVSLQSEMRTRISQAFKSNPKYDRLFQKKLITEDFSDDKKFEVFQKFTSYFKGFNINRRNMYSADKKPTAIAYRLVHDNLLIFVENMDVFEKLKAKFDTETLAGIFEEYQTFDPSFDVQSWEEVFSLDYFNHTFMQSQIDKYNALIGKIVTKDGKEIKGLNEHINLYNQKQKDKKNRLPLFTTLKKQILSDRQSLSWLPDLFEKDKDMVEAIENFYIKDRFEHSVLRPLKKLLESLDTYNLNGIFIKNNDSLSSLSQNVYRDFRLSEESAHGNYGLIAQALREKIVKENNQGKKTVEKYQEEIAKKVKAIESLSIQEINDLVNCYVSGMNSELCNNLRKVECYFSLMRKDVLGNNDLIENILLKLETAKKLFDNKLIHDDKYTLKGNDSQLIKELLDATKQLQYFIKPLLGTGEESDRDLVFYRDFLPLYEKFEELTLLYNKVRSWLTRKPYSKDKIKINFNRPTLLGGWDANKEKDNLCVILRKNNLYYLAIMDPGHNDCFKNKEQLHFGECYEKINYKYTTESTRMLPKIFISKKGRKNYHPDEEIISIYKSCTYKSGDNFNIKDCRALIDYYKDCIKKYKDWDVFDFHFSDTSSYTSMADFYAEVNAQGYKITFENISESYIERLVEEKKIYLFQIYNKDFSDCSKGTPNMHTLYWKMLFDNNNLASIVYKLDGGAEMFLRKASLSFEKPTHPANIPIPNKNKMNQGKQSVFKYDIIKNKRYTVHKFLFHVPITMNFNRSCKDLNAHVGEYIRKSNDLHIIGIDRGERNLLYYSVIDMKGNIIEQDSLNIICNGDLKTDYHELLDRREKERKESRQNWEAIESIKDLKKGYLSQAVHRIAQLMMKYNAVIALEDLGQMFVTRGQKIEKAVYQQFEQSLVEKLSYLVDKKKVYNEPGGALKAYQLAVSNGQNKKKQNGFLFYVPAWKTSKIDPVTGFTDLLHPKPMTKEKAKKFFRSFDDISYNDKGYFEFKINYKKFEKSVQAGKSVWTICTYGKRIRRKKDKGYWCYEEVDLTEEFIKLFEEFNITGYRNCNLKDAILSIDKGKFFDALIKMLQLTLQMRNSNGNGEDYIISPVANTDGCFFNSNDGCKDLPLDADANGAYNIARKGLWVVRKIKNSKKSNLYMSNKEWLKFAQTKPYLE